MPAVVSTNLTTSLSPAPDFSQTFYNRELLTRAKYRDYYGRWAASAAIPGKSGKYAVFRRYALLAMPLSPLTEGVPPAGKTPTLTDYQATLLQYGDFIALSDFADATGIDDYQRHWAGLLGEQAGYTLDAINRDVACAGTTVIYANGTQRTDINTVIDGNDLDRAIRSLVNNGTEKLLSGNGGTTTVGTYPVMPAFPAVTLPDVMFSLQNITGFKWASEYKGAAEGESGRYKTIAFFESPDPSALGAGGKKWVDAGGATNAGIKSNLGTSADVYSIMIFGKNGLTQVPLSSGSTKTYRKALGSAGTGDPLEQVMTMGWKNTSARLRTNENWLVRIECAAEV